MSDNYVKVMSGKTHVIIKAYTGHSIPADLAQLIQDGIALGVYTHAITWDNGALRTAYSHPDRLRTNPAFAQGKAYRKGAP